MRDRSAERGFTMVELMVVVAIVAVLAALVVPTFLRETRKTKASSEVTAMFAEIASKQEQYKLENSAYLAIPQCPSTPSATGYNFKTACINTEPKWVSLRVIPPESTMRCSYLIAVGAAGTAISAPTGFTSYVTADLIASSYFTILATCDENGKGGTNAQFFTTSVDRKVYSRNEGY